MPPATIETERLWLRQPHMTDLDALAAIYADSEVMRFIKDGTRPRPQTEETLHALIDAWEHNKIGVWMVIEKYTEHLLGICGFVGQAELFYRGPRKTPCFSTGDISGLVSLDMYVSYMIYYVHG
jgi:RimJ/RimL family protein N-acetyltransferase